MTEHSVAPTTPAPAAPAAPAPPRAVPGRRVPTALAALALGVRESTIRQWARRGKITRYGTRHQALYDLDELTALAAAAPGPAPRRS